MNVNFDALRAALGLLISQGLALVVGLKIVEMDADQLGLINAFLGTIVTMFFLFVKSNTPSAKGE